MSIIALTLAYIISRHHSGIPDGGTVSDILLESGEINHLESGEINQ